MNTLPFSISPDAAAWIVEQLQMADNDSDLAGLVPTLFLILGEHTRSQEGRILDWVRTPFFDFGWIDRDTAISEDYMEVEILGRQVFLETEALKRLDGNQLILKTMQVGFPTPSDKERLLLTVGLPNTSEEAKGDSGRSERGRSERGHEEAKGDSVNNPPVKGFGMNGQAFAFHYAPPVDSAGTLPDGRPFQNVRELKKLLVQEEVPIARNLARQLTIFATGAPVRFSDREAIEKILDVAKGRQYGVRSIVHAIVQNELFRNK